MPFDRVGPFSGTDAMRPAPLLASFDRRRTARRPRMVLVSRRTVVLARLSLLPLIAWTGATLWYFQSRSETSLKLLERQAVLKRNYEDKLTELRNRLDSMSGRQVADQETLEARLDTLLARQAAFENRHVVVQVLTDQAAGEGNADPRTTGSVDLSGGGVRAYAPAASSQFPDVFQLRLRAPDPAPPDRTSDIKALDKKLDRAARALDTLEMDQLRSLAAVRQSVDGQVAQLQTAIRKVGLNPDALDTGVHEGSGGPFVPTDDDGPFGTLAAQAETSVLRLNKLRRSAAALPFAEPIRGEIDLSSPFGYRLDPFTRTPAMHTGLDFKAEYGSVARATGAGRVTAAEYSGAYGNMVEIEHGHGFTSRYAHLSSIGVFVGQEVKAGAALGRVGSTGRSTGPHLHYETRFNGDALDPQRFLKAGALIGPMVSR
jgi:hypothetical protein